MYWLWFIIQFIWTFIALGLTSMMLPAIADGKGVVKALKQSIQLCRENFVRIFVYVSAMVIMLGFILGPSNIYSPLLLGRYRGIY